MNLVPDWTGLVVSGTNKPSDLQEGDGQFSDFRNALLYCDKVFWLPQEYLSARISKSVVGWIAKKVYDQHRISVEKLNEIREKLHRITQLNASHLVAEVDKLLLQLRERPSMLKEQFDELLDSSIALEGAMSKAITELQDAGLSSSYQLLVEERSFYEQLVIGQEFSYTAQMPDPDLVIIPSASAEQLGWMKTAIAQQSLAISRLYLPDVGQLPFHAIAEMRDHLRPYLNPMRAELLRLTEDLRQMVRDTADASEVATEAEYLVRVRVEPLIREVGQRAEKLMKKKWRRLFQGVAKVFGLTGAAYFKPDLLKDALKEVLDTGAALADLEENKEALSDTACFVLEARRYIQSRCE